MSAPRSDQLNLVVLDTCLNNPYDPANVSTVQPPSRTIVAYATAPGEYAADGSQHGTYTAALLRAITQPGRNMADVFDDVSRSVSHSTQGRQVPWMAEDLPRRQTRSSSHRPLCKRATATASAADS